MSHPVQLSKQKNYLERKACRVAGGLQHHEDVIYRHGKLGPMITCSKVFEELYYWSSALNSHNARIMHHLRQSFAAVQGHWSCNNDYLSAKLESNSLISSRQISGVRTREASLECSDDEEHEVLQKWEPSSEARVHQTRRYFTLQSIVFEIPAVHTWCMDVDMILKKLVSVWFQLPPFALNQNTLAPNCTSAAREVTILTFTSARLWWTTASWLEKSHGQVQIRAVLIY